MAYRTLDMMRSTAFRRTRWVAAAGLAAMTAVAVVPGRAGAADTTPVDPGTGLALAQTWKIDPRAAGLSIGITFGQSTATHQNLSAKAVSTAVNLGVVGITLAAQQCDGSAPTWPADQQPQPLTATSNDPKADDGVTENEQGFPGLQKYVRANKTPYGVAITKTGPFALGTSGIEMGNGVATTKSGVIDGVRKATATVDIDYLAVGAGVFLSQLHWEATWASNQSAPTGTFTFGGGSINGTPMTGSDQSDNLEKANQYLATVGLHITPGKMHVSNGLVVVDPLSIDVVPNKTRDDAFNSTYSPLFNGYTSNEQNVGLSRLFEEMIKGNCKSANLITIYDILLGSMTGAGSFALQVGGAQASSGELASSPYVLGDTQYETIGGGDFSLPGTPDETVTYDVGGGTTDGGGTPTVPTPTTAPAKTAPRIVDIPKAKPVENSLAGTRGGAMLGVGIATLALLAAAAEGDRRKMRQAVRIMTPSSSAPQE